MARAANWQRILDALERLQTKAPAEREGALDAGRALDLEDPRGETQSVAAQPLDSELVCASS
jgi:hypothetical protein